MVISPLEKTIEAKTRAYAKSKGVHVYKFSSPAHAGVPDRMFIFPCGRLVFVEFKRANGKLTPLQTREIKTLTSLHQEVHVVYNLEQGMQLIDKYVRQEQFTSVPTEGS